MVLSQKVAFNTLIQIVSKAITVVFGLLTTILLTTYLGREGYGDYMYILALVVIFGALADWGTATIGVREASRQEEKQEVILANVFVVRLAFAFLAGLLMFLTALFIPLESADPLVVRRGIMIGSLVLYYHQFSNFLTFLVFN
jgi:O-antigen/teichoic acid export membrane protein